MSENKLQVEFLAKAIYSELHGCFVPTNCFEKPIKIKKGDPWAWDHSLINKRRAEQRKWLLDKAAKILARLEAIEQAIKE